MRTYSSYWVWFRNEPFITVLANDQKEVEQFIVDWCQSNSVKPVADEWLIRAVDSVVAKDVVNEIVQEVGGGSSIMSGLGMVPTKGQIIPGMIKMKMHPRCFN